MYLVYTPDGQEPQRFPYNPRKMMSPEMEAIERVTGRGFSQFTTEVLQGNALCRRALLWVLQKRKHPTLKFAEVEFAWDELKLEHSKQEFELMISQVIDSTTGAEQAAVVAKLEAEMATAIDEDGDELGGKAQLPIAD